ncbi:hypothetical protein Q8F55_002547 [Vanrija albida]|uniref:Uncharacterized protein n=1 Tax=Vanrija albida TaxID=181172 RepID=A0ABR3QA73_9TREE
MPPKAHLEKQFPSRTPRSRPASGLAAAANDVSTPPPAGTSGSGIRLGLAALPSDASPLGVSRPAAPSRVKKRISATPSPRPSPSHTSLQSLSNETSRAATPERYTGTITDRTEEELGLASRQALQDALRREWLGREKFIARIDELDTIQQTQEDKLTDGAKAFENVQGKFESALNEQAVLEAELEAANDLIDRLRHSGTEAERQLRQSQRRYADQEKAFEAERSVHLAEQQHLHQRIKSLSAERSARPNTDDAHAALQEELVTITASHQTLVQQLTTLADELHEIKADNAKLVEENESWQLLIEERTLAGTMRGGLLPATTEGANGGSNNTTAPSSIRIKEPNALETLEEQLEMDELHSELEQQQSIFDESDRVLTAELQRVSSGGSFLSASPNNGGSLAAELGSIPSFAELDTLRTENKTLKESNKALALYCSKILDRILASEGYEHVLSTDYRTRRGLRPTSTSSKPKLNIEELAKTMETNGPPPVPELPPRPAPPAPAASKPRPQSMLLPRSTSSTNVTARSAGDVSPPKKDDDKRARRGFSIDFRSLGFGPAEKPEPKPVLKPLQLASRAAPAAHKDAPNPRNSTSSMPPPPLPSPSVSVARKLDPTEEDEEDLKERHRMQAALKLMGIDPNANNGTIPPPPSQVLADNASAKDVEAATPSSSGAGSWFSRRLSRQPTATTTSASAQNAPASESAPVPSDRSERGRSTPLARLSVVLSANDVAAITGGLQLSDVHPDMDEGEAAAAALRAYDAREREQARLLAEGKSQAAYTSPSKVLRPSITRSNSTISTGSSDVGGTVARNSFSSDVRNSFSSEPRSYTNGASKHQPRASVSTLWSMGSSTTEAEHLIEA